MYRKSFLYVIFFVFMIALLGCMRTDSDLIHTPKEPGGMRYPVQVKDQMGNVVEIPKQPERIVSLVPSATEIAFALDLDEQVVAVTTNDDYPAKVKNLPTVGDMNINVSEVIAQKPDIVLASSLNDLDTINKLRDLEQKVIVLEANTVKEVYQSIDIVGQATNRSWEAEQLIAKMEKDIRDVYTRVVRIPEEERRKVWVEVGPELFTVGGDTFLNELLTLAGGVNVAGSEEGWPQISAEKVIQWQPDVIISTYGQEEEILKRTAWQTVPAIQQQQVYAIDPNLVNRSGPRINQGVRELAKILYPDQFEENKE